MNQALYDLFKPYIATLENPTTGIVKEINDRKKQLNAHSDESERNRIIEDEKLLNKFKENLTRWSLDSSLDVTNILESLGSILAIYKDPAISELNYILSLLLDSLKKAPNTANSGSNVSNNSQKVSHPPTPPQQQPPVQTKNIPDKTSSIIYGIFNFLHATLLVSIFSVFMALNLFLLNSINAGITNNSQKLHGDKIASDSLLVKVGQLLSNTEPMNTKILTNKISKSGIESSESPSITAFEALVNSRSTSIPSYTLIISFYFLIGIVVLFTIYQLTLKVLKEIVKIKMHLNSRRNIEFILSLNDTSITDAEIKKFWEESIKNYFEIPVNQESSLEYLIRKIRLTSK